MLWKRLDQFLKGPNQSDEGRILLQTYIFAVFFLVELYSLFYLYIGAYFMFVFIFLAPILQTPLILYFEKKRYHFAARWLFIFSGLSYICSTHIGVKQDVTIEFYCIPLTVMCLILFDSREKDEIIIGLSTIFLSWIFIRFCPSPELSNIWYADNFPESMFKSVNFIGAFSITAFFSVNFGLHALKLKNTMGQELQKSKQMEALLENAQRLSKIGNWDLDLKTHHFYCSKEQLKIFEVEELNTENFLHLVQSKFHPEDAAMPARIFKTALELKQRFEFEIRIISKTGETKYISVRGEPSLDSEKNVIRFTGTAQDFTEQIKLNSMVLDQQMKMAQSSRLATIGEMAAGVAHEINNPLAIIHGKISQSLQIINRGSFDVNKVKLNLEKAISTIDRISKIIKGLRSIGRVSDNDPMLIVSLKQIIEETLDLCGERLKNGGVTLKFELLKDFDVECRSTEISQVLLNLLNNSFDAIQDNKDKWIEIKVKDLNSKVNIFVIDCGDGIPSAIIDKMMNPFFTTKEIGKGTGLGLSISMGIMKNHQGQLRYQEEQKHTCFVIDLPKRQKTRAPSAA